MREVWATYFTLQQTKTLICYVIVVEKLESDSGLFNSILCHDFSESIRYCFLPILKLSYWKSNYVIVGKIWNSETENLFEF